MSRPQAVLEEKAVLESERVSLQAEAADLRSQLALLGKEKEVLVTEGVGLREELSSLREQTQATTSEGGKGEGGRC